MTYEQVSENMALFENELARKQTSGMIPNRKMLSYDSDHVGCACADCKFFKPDARSKTEISISGRCTSSASEQDKVSAESVRNCPHFKIRFHVKRKPTSYQNTAPRPFDTGVERTVREMRHRARRDRDRNIEPQPPAATDQK